ncbi:hypothetical protein ACDI16_13870 [Oceanobacillus caeni]
MKKTLQIASAFMGVIIGAGFASGQEILQYFTSFGVLGIVGAIIATIIFAYVGATLMKIGSRLQTTSHKEAIYKISGKYVGAFIDFTIIITLFGVGVVMIAGAGANLNQQFGISHYIGTSLMAFLVLLTGMLNVKRVIALISSITPFLFLIIIVCAVYCIFTMDTSFFALDSIAKNHPTNLPNWFISVINYVSFNIAVGASMAFVIGGAEQNEKTATLGGLFGGLGIGILIVLSNLSIFSKIKNVAGYEMPLLEIVNNISPVLGFFMSIVLFGMIYNTAISMFFAFGARFTEMETPKFKVFLTIIVLVGFCLSFFGFSGLVSYLYPFIGYLGLFLIVALIVASVRMSELKEKNHIPLSGDN